MPETNAILYVNYISINLEKNTYEARGALGFPGCSVNKESSCNAGDPGSIPGLGRSPVEGDGHPLQYSCLASSMDRGAWRATVHGVTKSQTQLRD